jgi:hypothetical protein
MSKEAKSCSCACHESKKAVDTQLQSFLISALDGGE